VSEAPDVREDHPVNGLTLYSKCKALCEPLLFRHQSPDFVCAILRPATVCGYAPRMRFDLTANLMTAHAILKGAITVFGGKQQRAHLHIRDMVDCYRLMLTAPDEKIAGQVFNVGCQNLKVSEIAEMVADEVYSAQEVMYPRPTIETQVSTDDRSYSINSDKIRDALGFVPKFTIADAVGDLCNKFANGMFKDALTSPAYTNIKQLVDRGFAVQDSLASFRQARY
jgi:nucleoside-diphosphate-sugar epimerase